MIKSAQQKIFGEFKPVFEDHFPLSPDETKIVDDFHKLYFRLNEKKPGLLLSWMGFQTGKLPSDLWIYQELIFSFRPDLIIECGTHKGGSALFFADIFDRVGSGNILTVDLYPQPNLPTHSRIQYLNGSSISKETFSLVKDRAINYNNIMVILDSNHSRDHVLEELRLYSPFVPVGGLIIVEDSFLNGHPSHNEFGPGPMEAIDQFIKDSNDFVIDRSFEKFLFTLNRRGFLRRVA